MYVYLLRTQSIQISKTKLPVRMASESERFGLFREVVKITGPSVLMRVGCVRLLPDAKRREVVSHIQHLGTSNFYYPLYHVVFV